MGATRLPKVGGRSPDNTHNKPQRRKPEQTLMASPQAHAVGGGSTAAASPTRPPRNTGIEVDYPETGMPWLDRLQADMETEQVEITQAGQRVGQLAAYQQSFSANLPGHPASLGAPAGAGSPQAGGQVAMRTQAPPAQLRPLPTLRNSHRSPLAGLAAGAGKPVAVPYAPNVSLPPPETGAAGTRGTAKQQLTINDYSMLALASQRVGKGRNEANAYYKLGEIYSQSPETLPKAVKHFQKYYSLCKRLEDASGTAKALNCLGIVYQETGDMESALACHTSHLEVADASSLFIAHSNIGIVKGLMHDYEGAMHSHKTAMQCAIRCGDQQAELLALANIGLIGRQQHDYNTAQMCMSRHLELAQSINDPSAQHESYEQLAALQTERQDWASAHTLYTNARELNKHNKEPTAHARDGRLKCKIGLVKAKSEMEQYFRHVARNMGVHEVNPMQIDNAGQGPLARRDPPAIDEVE